MVTDRIKEFLLPLMGIGIFVVIVVVWLFVSNGKAKKNTAQPVARQTVSAAPQQSAPARIVAPPFFVSHQDELFATLIVPKQTTDFGVRNLIWLLRDAARSQTLNSLGISQTLVNSRNRIYTFHIYRGTKCAERVYRNHRPPCAVNDRELAFYQVGSFVSPDGDGALLFPGGSESKSEVLLPAGSPYTPKPYIVANAENFSVRSNEENGSWGSTAQRKLAEDFTEKLWGGGLRAKFSTSPNHGELKMSADWLIAADERSHVAVSFKVLHQREACSVGFRTLRFSSSFSSSSDSILPLNCLVSHGGD